MLNQIPGYLTNDECYVLAELANKFNYSGAIAVEIGSLHGKSSSIISKSMPLGVVHCIDPWWGNDSSAPDTPDDLAIKNSWPVRGTLNTVEFFTENVRDCHNIVTHKILSPQGIRNWNITCDFVFLDAGHKNPSDRLNIDYWLPRIKSGGIFAGHDYYPGGESWSDIKTNVEYLEDYLGQKVTNPQYTSIWYFNL